MLPIINSYRQSGNAWVLDRNNNRQNLGKLSALTYDYNLEKIAMQRAMEISVRYDSDHMRPNNTKYFTCTYGSTSSYGECILGASFPFNTNNAYTEWMEENEPYDFQGHRRLILGNFKTIGIGHVERDGCHFWTIEFGYNNTNPSASAPNNSATTLPVVVLNDYLRYSLTTEFEEDSIRLRYSSTFDLTEILESVSAGAYKYLEPPITTIPTNNWTSSNNSVISVSGSTLTATGVGSAQINIKTSAGTTVSMPFNVYATSIISANIRLEKDTYTYTGKPIKPNITVTYNNKTLVENVDYTISYTNNKGPGLASVDISGIGNFKDKNFAVFYISRNKSGSNNTNKDNANLWSDDDINSDINTIKYKNVVYSVDGQSATVVGISKNITSYTAPKTVNINGQIYNVTKISKEAFKNNKKLKIVNLTKSNITQIDSKAFYGCSKLKTIKLNASKQKKVKKQAFYKIAKDAKFTIKASNKKAYNKLVKAIKKSKVSNVSFKKK